MDSPTSVRPSGDFSRFCCELWIYKRFIHSSLSLIHSSYPRTTLKNSSSSNNSQLSVAKINLMYHLAWLSSSGCYFVFVNFPFFRLFFLHCSFRRARPCCRADVLLLSTSLDAILVRRVLYDISYMWCDAVGRWKMLYKIHIFSAASRWDELNRWGEKMNVVIEDWKNKTTDSIWSHKETINTEREFLSKNRFAFFSSMTANFLISQDRFLFFRLQLITEKKVKWRRRRRRLWWWWRWWKKKQQKKNFGDSTYGSMFQVSIDEKSNFSLFSINKKNFFSFLLSIYFILLDCALCCFCVFLFSFLPLNPSSSQ